MDVSRNILAKNQNFKKTETWFCRWKSTANNDVNIFLSLKNPCTFLLAKEKTWKRIFNTYSELSQNRTEKQIMLSKSTVNLVFNDICYVVMGCFDWKVGIFQQTVVRVLLYPYPPKQTTHNTYISMSSTPPTCRKKIFLWKKTWRNALASKSKKVQGYSGKRLFWNYYLQLSFVYKSVSQISFKLFCSGDKRIS